MQFNHDNMTGPRLAAALSNLVSSERWSTAALREVLVDHEIRRPSIDEEIAGALQAWSLLLRAAFQAGSVDARCDRVNELLAAGAGAAYVSMHDGLRPHLHFAADEDTIVARVRSVTAGGLAVFIVEAEGDRLGSCARAGCQMVFVDTSRNGKRRYCSARCGNADAVKRHRAKLRD